MEFQTLILAPPSGSRPNCRPYVMERGCCKGGLKGSGGGDSPPHRGSKVGQTQDTVPAFE